MHGTSPERDERSLLESGDLSGDGDDDIAPSVAERLRLAGITNQLDLGARELFLQGATSFGSGDVAARDLFNFNQTNYITTHTKPRPLVFGQVGDSELDGLAETYYRPAEFDRLRNSLLNNRVQVLRGRQGTGRTTTALLVLRTLNRRVHSLEPPDERSSLIESLKDAFAYVMEVPDDSVGTPGYMTGAMLHAIREKLQRIDAYLVIIADNVVIEGPALRDFIVPWSSPPPKAVLQHLVALARTSGIRELFNNQKLRSAIEKEPVRRLVPVRSPISSASWRSPSTRVRQPSRSSTDYSRICMPRSRGGCLASRRFPLRPVNSPSPQVLP